MNQNSKIKKNSNKNQSLTARNYANIYREIIKKNFD